MTTNNHRNTSSIKIIILAVLLIAGILFLTNYLHYNITYNIPIIVIIIVLIAVGKRRGYERRRERTIQTNLDPYQPTQLYKKEFNDYSYTNKQDSSTQKEEVNYCNFCGAMNITRSNYCENCGRKFN